MKKKGLIISTVVMVVVLIASLTTATYAWFTTTASAKVNELEVKTTASHGLQVAHYNPADHASLQYSNGEGTVDESTKEFWAGANTGWGSTVSFGTDALSFYGVSGNGVKDKMFKIKTEGEEPQISDDGKVNDSALMAMAGVNVDYFVAYIALSNTVEGNNKIVLESIDVTATAGENGQNFTGMAKSLRIAIFAVDTISTGADDFTADTLKMVCAPYANTTYDAGQNTWGTAGDGNALKYISGEDTDTAESRTVAGGDATYKDMKKENASGLTGWIAGTTGATDTNGPTTAKLDKTALQSITLKTSNVVSGSSDQVYLKLVIWFEGEDPGCLNKFAGGGATINIAFTTEAIGG